MRRRIAIAAAPLLVLLILAVIIPAAVSLANRHTSVLLSDRLLDASRFASLTRDALTGSDARLEAELDAYAELYDTTIWLVGREGDELHATGPHATAGLPQDALPLVDAALSGNQQLSTETVIPLGPEHLTLVAPVGHDSQVIAALVMQVPTDALRSRIGRDWGVLGVSALTPLAVLFWLIWPISGWVVRPLESLSGSMNRMRAGDLSVRADTDAGPPELKGVAKSFNAMADTVVSTLSRQQQFVADASHQLRNPLASMHIAVENLEPYLDGDDEAEEAYEEALQTVDRMEGVVSDLLAATRLQRAQGQPRSGVRMSAVPVARWQELTERAGGRLETDLAPALVVEPTGGMEILVEELVDNAFRLGQARHVTVRGRVRDDAHYEILVEDDGRGLSPEELELAATRFWRSPTNQNIPGTGLGLSIARQAVEDAAGALELEGATTGGLRVRIVLPLADAADAPGRAGVPGPNPDR